MAGPWSPAPRFHPPSHDHTRARDGRLGRAAPGTPHGREIGCCVSSSPGRATAPATRDDPALLLVGDDPSGPVTRRAEMSGPVDAGTRPLDRESFQALRTPRGPGHEEIDMPFVQVKVNESVVTDDQKQQIVRSLTDAMVGIEGENMRPVTWCVVEEARSGSPGIAGTPLTTADVKALAAGVGV